MLLWSVCGGGDALAWAQETAAQETAAQETAAQTAAAQQTRASDRPARADAGSPTAADSLESTLRALTTQTKLLGDTRGPLFLPAQNSPNQGFQAAVEIGVLDSVGYVPVRIIVLPQATTTADRQLVFRFTSDPTLESPSRNGLVVDVPVSLPQGTTRQIVTRYLPKWSAGQWVTIKVLENGRELDGYEGEMGVGVRRRPQPTGSWLSRERRVDLLYVREDDEQAAMSRLKRRFAEKAFELTASVGGAIEPSIRELLTTLSVVPVTVTVSEGDQLPLDWRGYQRFDSVVVDQALLAAVGKDAARLAALRAWVLAGGSLIVDQGESMEAVCELLTLKYVPPSNIDDRLQVAIGTAQQSLWTLGSLHPSGASEWVDRDQTVSQQEIDEVAAHLKLSYPGAGRVFVADRQFDRSLGELVAIASFHSRFRYSPMLRRGVDPLLGSRRFSEWTVPGVAEPPVYTFIGLLSVFVVLVGPVAYRRTSKIGRSYLMFAIAPILALLTTLAMFGYGIVSDGFGVSARVRQLTWIDGASGDAAERIRSTFFAGLSPREGLRFSDNAEVFWFPENLGKSWKDLDALSPEMIGRVTVHDDRQQFDSAFLPARQQRQFVSHRPRANIGSLRLRLQADRATLHSTLDFRLRRVVIRDADSGYWGVDQIGANESLACRRLTLREASEALGDLYNDFQPQSRVTQRGSGRRRTDNETYDVLAMLVRNLNENISESQGIFERWLQVQLQTYSDLPPGHFVAISEVSPDVVAAEQCELKKSVRYVFGTLP